MNICATAVLCFREGNGNPLQYSCLENPIDKGAWQATVHVVTKSRTQLSDLIFTFHFHALEKEMATHSSVLPGESQGWGSLVGCYGVTQGRTRLKRLSKSSNTKYLFYHHFNSKSAIDPQLFEYRKTVFATLLQTSTFFITQHLEKLWKSDLFKF